MSDHRFSDHSVHGGSFYLCDFCGCHKSNQNAKLPCPRAEACLRQEEENAEMKEQCEYVRLKEMLARLEYLKAKYEGKP